MSATGTEVVTLKRVADSIGNMPTADPTPSTDPDHWQLVPTGTEEGGGGETPEPTIPEYDPKATYNKGDTCVYGGVTYVCQKNNVTGVTPGSDGKTWIAE